MAANSVYTDDEYYGASFDQSTSLRNSAPFPTQSSHQGHNVSMDSQGSEYRDPRRTNAHGHDGPGGHPPPLVYHQPNFRDVRDRDRLHRQAPPMPAAHPDDGRHAAPRGAGVGSVLQRPLLGAGPGQNQHANPNQLPPWVKPDVVQSISGILGGGPDGLVGRAGAAGGAGPHVPIAKVPSMELHQRFLASLAAEVRQQAQKQQLAHLAITQYHAALQASTGATKTKKGTKTSGLLHVAGSAHCKAGQSRPGPKGGRRSKKTTDAGSSLPPPPPPPPPPDKSWFIEIEAKLAAFASQLGQDRALDRALEEEDHKRKELDRLKYAVLIQKLEEMNSLHKDQLQEERDRLRTNELMKERERERKDLERQREMEKQARELIMKEREDDRKQMERERKEIEKRWMERQAATEQREHDRVERERIQAAKDREEQDRDKAAQDRERDERERERAEWSRERKQWERVNRERGIQEEHLQREKSALADTLARLRSQMEDVQRKNQTSNEEIIRLQHLVKELNERVKLSDDLSDKVHQLTQERKRRDDDDENLRRARTLEASERRQKEERLREREKQMEEATKANEREWEDRVRRLENEMEERTRRKEDEYARKRQELEARMETKQREFQHERERWYEEKQMWMHEVESERVRGGSSRGKLSTPRPGSTGVAVATPRASSSQRAQAHQGHRDSAWASGPLPRDRMVVR